MCLALNWALLAGNLGTRGKREGSQAEVGVRGDRCFHQSYYLWLWRHCGLLVGCWLSPRISPLSLWLLVTHYGDTFHPTSHECPGLWVPAHPVPLTLKLSSPCFSSAAGKSCSSFKDQFLSYLLCESPCKHSPSCPGWAIPSPAPVVLSYHCKTSLHIWY